MDRCGAQGPVSALHAGRERLALLPPVKHLIHGLFDREFGVVQYQSVLRGRQGGDATGHVPGVARLQVCAKVDYCSG